MLNLVRGLTWSCNMDRIETINNAIMYNQSYCLKRGEYISNSSSILPPQLYRCNILNTSKLHRLFIYAFDNNATKMALSNPIISVFFMCNIHKRC